MLKPLPLVSDETDEPTLRAIFTDVRSRDAKVPNLYRTLGNSPSMLKGWIGLTWPLRHDAKSPRHLRELAIMRVAQLKQAPYPWAHHWQMALASGLTESQLTSLKRWRDSNDFDADQRLVLAYTDAIAEDQAIDESLWDELTGRFSPEEMVELALAATFYINLAHLSTALAIPLESEFERYTRGL